MAGHQLLINKTVMVCFEKLQFLGIIQNKICSVRLIQMTVIYKFWQFVSVVHSSNIYCQLSWYNIFSKITKYVSCHDREHSENMVICIRGSLNHKARNF
jgi:hypothetical protein